MRSLSASSCQQSVSQVFHLQQLEMIHVVSSNDTPLAEIIGPRKNLHHQGSTAGDSVYGVSKNSLDAESLIARLGIETKAKLLGAARVSDQSRGRRKSSSDAAAGSSSGAEVGVPEPINWSAPHKHLVEELAHRFKPRVVYLLTASCPTTILPLLAQGIPVCAAGALSASHAFQASG